MRDGFIDRIASFVYLMLMAFRMEGKRETEILVSHVCIRYESCMNMCNRTIRAIFRAIKRWIGSVEVRLDGEIS